MTTVPTSTASSDTRKFADSTRCIVPGQIHTDGHGCGESCQLARNAHDQQRAADSQLKRRYRIDPAVDLQRIRDLADLATTDPDQPVWVQVHTGRHCTDVQVVGLWDMDFDLVVQAIPRTGPEAQVLLSPDTVWDGMVRAGLHRPAVTR